jgi:hypothetical protein
MTLNIYDAIGCGLSFLGMGFSGAMLLVSYDKNSSLTMDRLSAPAWRGMMCVWVLSVVLFAIGFLQS